MRIKGLIQAMGLLALLDGVFRLTESVSAHTSGLNRFEVRDALELVAALAYLLAGYGTVLMRNWARMLLLACYLCRIVFQGITFYGFIQNVPNNIDAWGWFRLSLVFLFPSAIVLLLGIGWRRAVSTVPIIVTRKWRNAAAAAGICGVGLSLLGRMDFGETATPHDGLEFGFLQRANRMVFYTTLNSLFSLERRGWRVSVQSKDGKIEIYPFPPGGDSLVKLDPQTGILSIFGAEFSPSPYEATPAMLGKLKLRGIRFARESGPIQGTFVFAQDETEKLYLLIDSLDLHGKNYAGIWFSPNRE